MLNGCFKENTFMALERLGFWNCTACLVMSKSLELEISELIRFLEASEKQVA